MKFFEKYKIADSTPSGKDSPYLAARAEWLERYGNYIQRAAQWRLFALICLGLACVSVAGNIFQGLQFKVVPYVVEVDRLGKAVGVARADVAAEIPTRVIQAEIANAIVNWRTVTADLELQQKMVARLSAFVTGGAKGVLKTWFEQNNPYQRAKETLVTVNIKGLPLPVSKDSWRIEWTEVVRNHAGITLSSTAFEATVSVRITPPTTDMQIMANPGGVVFTDIAFGKLLAQ